MKIENVKSKKIAGFDVAYINSDELDAIYKEVFEKETYKTKLPHSPRILDCGAHIGLTTLYLKREYPDSRITSFEPSPITFEIMKRNVSSNKLKDVDLVNAALSNKSSEIDFYVDTSTDVPWGWGDSIIKNIWPGTHPTKIKVKSVKLSNWLNEYVDFLKLDIEGGETIVLEEIKEHLENVENIYIDFHGTPKSNPDNQYGKVVKLLEDRDFRVHISPGIGKLVAISKISDNYRAIIRATHL